MNKLDKVILEISKAARDIVNREEMEEEVIYAIVIGDKDHAVKMGSNCCDFVGGD